jgi:3-oxoacyl-[acyl-carrier protein] reductase
VQLEDKVALVTGGTRGIGRAIVEALAGDGARVAFTYATSREQAEEIAYGDRIIGWQGDAADTERAGVIVAEVRERLGRIDILVNNAGITRDKLLVRMSEADWDEVLDTNLKSVYNFTRPAAAAMLRHRSGTILNISSVSGVTGMPGQANYSASKAGMIGFTKALARELAKAHITVNALALGMIETDMTRALDPAYRQKALDQIPLGRFGEASEIAGIARFLVSPAAAYITGQVIQIDGGLAI